MTAGAAWLIVGLGNPGHKYERTRHNIGFRVAETLVDRHRLPAFRVSKFGGDVSLGNIAESAKVVVLKPMEFMNLSGFAVQRVAGFHHIAVDNILVIHDEIDLEFGLVRIKSGGGHGGHNGLRSITDQLGNKYARIRVGVGKPAKDATPCNPGGPSGAADKDVAGWVLGDFPSNQTNAVDAMIDASVLAVQEILHRGIAAAMNARNCAKSVVADLK
jgi:peptidyl-tRNA hydrolase, PTH1 family